MVMVHNAEKVTTKPEFKLPEFKWLWEKASDIKKLAEKIFLLTRWKIYKEWYKASKKKSLSLWGYEWLTEGQPDS